MRAHVEDCCSACGILSSVLPLVVIVSAGMVLETGTRSPVMLLTVVPNFVEIILLAICSYVWHFMYVFLVTEDGVALVQY